MPSRTRCFFLELTRGKSVRGCSWSIVAHTPAIGLGQPYRVSNACRVFTVQDTGFQSRNAGMNLLSRVSLAAAAPKLKPVGFSDTTFTSVGLPAASTLTDKMAAPFCEAPLHCIIPFPRQR